SCHDGHPASAQAQSRTMANARTLVGRTVRDSSGPGLPIDGRRGPPRKMAYAICWWEKAPARAMVRSAESRLREPQQMGQVAACHQLECLLRSGRSPGHLHLEVVVIMGPVGPHNDAFRTERLDGVAL